MKRLLSSSKTFTIGFDEFDFVTMSQWKEEKYD